MEYFDTIFFSDRLSKQNSIDKWLPVVKPFNTAYFHIVECYFAFSILVQH